MLLRRGFALCMLFLLGCATPPEVKQLSVRQNDYFDAAIAAVKIQSDALILATEKLVEQSKQRITILENENRKSLEDLMKEGQTPENAKRISEDLAKSVITAENSRKKLDSDLASIKQKTGELQLFLEKMKQVNITLDSYIQSEKAGEAIVKDVMNQPTVSSFLNSVNELTPKLQTGGKEIDAFLKSVK